MRSALLAGSQNAWLRERATRYRFVRRSVSRFMPGESLDDALPAARELQTHGISAILTRLGENVTTLAEADSVTSHYLEAIDRIHEMRLTAEISIKPTQLGIDLSDEACYRQLKRLVDHAETRDTRVWIDMESSKYVDPTLDLFRRIRADSPRVGVCLQAYLHRTAADLEALLPLGPAIRLVKGAYKELPSVAIASKPQVDENFFTLASRLMDATRDGCFVGLATHDEALIHRLEKRAAARGLRHDRFEFEMLYGIKAATQRRLQRSGCAVRVLVSYGEYWFPWYMRRLAERPANIWFVAKNLLR